MANKNLKKSLQDRVKEFTITLPCMEGREKGEMERLHGSTVTIVDYGFMKDEDKEYVAFVTKEDPQHFYFGGQVLSDNMKKLDEDGYGDEIRKDGLPIYFDVKKSKNGLKYTTVEFYPAE